MTVTSNKSARSLFLIGMMGSGKSVTGKKLAGLLRMPFVDLDEQIEKEAGETIARIFEGRGEAVFRNIERRVLRGLPETPACVIAGGGGVVLDPENRKWMKSRGIVIYLETSLDCLWSRVKDAAVRPLLKSENPKEKLRMILEARKPLYKKTSDHSVVTDLKSAAQVAEEIAELLLGKQP